MPIYEYSCTDCKKNIDLMQKITDEPLKICPNCSHDTLVKLVSAAGFQLKGSGWYATDFKKTPSDKPDKPSTETTAPTDTTA